MTLRSALVPLACAVAMVAGTLQDAEAESSLDIKGLTAGMASDEILEVAGELAASPDDIRDHMVAFQTPQGEQLDETAHNTYFAFDTPKNESYLVVITRKPMDERAHSIKRSVRHSTADPTKLTSLSVYRDALIAKYGEPYAVDDKGRLGTVWSRYFYFADGEIPEGCPVKVPDISATVTTRWTGASLEELKRCPTLLKVQVRSLNQPHNPVTKVEFQMKDPYLYEADVVGYKPYWSKWMHDYLQSQPMANEKPDL